MDIVYLDFQKAFDKVPHVRLISKLNAHGINGNVSKWIAAWLSGRKQRVTLGGAASGWSDVRSGVPQGSVLGPVLFTIFINDIDENIVSNIIKFADDTKIFSCVDNTDDAMLIVKDLDLLYAWSQDWQMSFNVEKCKVLHIGRNNDCYNYTMNGKVLHSIDEEKDLGVVIHKSLKPSRHIAESVKKANRTLGIINRCFSYKDMKIILPLYKSLVRPLLEYCSPAWSPFLKQDIVLIEKVQRRFTRMVPGLRELPYNLRLDFLGLIPLEVRRMRSDLIEVFKILKGIVKINISDLFTIRESTITRGHNLKLYKKQCNLNVRKHFFNQRVVNVWNSLPVEAVESTTINAFKSHLTTARLKLLLGDYTSQTDDSLPRQPSVPN